MGSCTLKNIWEIINPWNGFPTIKIISNAGMKESRMPILECKSLWLYASPKNPANIEEPAIPEVIVDDIPARSRAAANIIPALLPTNGTSNCCAWSNSSTGICSLKKVEAERRIIAELIPQPITIDRRVS